MSLNPNEPYSNPTHGGIIHIPQQRPQSDVIENIDTDPTETHGGVVVTPIQ